jgi:Type IV secretion system pilin
MKKIRFMSRLFASLFLLTALLLPSHAIAVDVLPDDICNKSPKPAVCKDDQNTATENPLFGDKGIITRAVSLLSRVLGIVAVFVLIVAGVRFITSAGNQQTISSVRSQIIYAVVGLAVAASAQILVLMVLKKL